jgi:hypothetical protein
VLAAAGEPPPARPVPLPPEGRKAPHRAHPLEPHRPAGRQRPTLPPPVRIDVLAQVHAGWTDKLARTLGVSLASVAPAVWHGGGHAGMHAPGPDAPGPLPHAEMARAAQKALALAQQEKSTWTRADLVEYLAGCCPGRAWTRLRPPRCLKRSRTGRWPRSSSRWPAWRRPSRCRCRPACCARTGAASISGTAACGSPRTGS